MYELVLGLFNDDLSIDVSWKPLQRAIMLKFIVNTGIGVVGINLGYSSSGVGII